MTDISDLREGDEIEAVIRLRVTPFAAINGGIRVSLPDLSQAAERVTVVRPEIIPGQPYVDADGKLYIGKSGDRIVHINAEGIGIYYLGDGPDQYRPLPAGLRPAKVVPE